MKIKNHQINPLLIYPYLTARGFTHFVPDEMHLKIMFRSLMGYNLDLDNPKTFNEKLQWLKLHDRNPIYVTMVDKISAKSWAAGVIGEKYITPLLDAWDSAEDINIDELPEQFVLKTNHNSGGLAICRDRSYFDFLNAKRFLGEQLKKNYYWNAREWPYKNIKPRIFAEEYLDIGDSDARQIDYKFYCFNGKPKFIYVARGMEDHKTTQMDFLNLDWTIASFKRHDYAHFDYLPQKPACFDEMLMLSEKLSKGIPFVRVDFFEHRGIPRFSEMTFSPNGGFMPFDPPEWDEKIGKLLNIDV